MLCCRWLPQIWEHHIFLPGVWTTAVLISWNSLLNSNFQAHLCNAKPIKVILTARGLSVFQDPFPRDAKNTWSLPQEMYSLVEKKNTHIMINQRIWLHLTTKLLLSHPTGFGEEGAKLSWFLSTLFTNKDLWALGELKTISPHKGEGPLFYRFLTSWQSSLSPRRMN